MNPQEADPRYVPEDEPVSRHLFEPFPWRWAAYWWTVAIALGVIAGLAFLAYYR